jgi:hypothetical protein
MPKAQIIIDLIILKYIGSTNEKGDFLMNLDGITIALLILILCLGVIGGAFFVLWFQRRKGKVAKDNEVEDFRKVAEEKRKEETLAANTEKVKDFLEFDKIEDDMIIQDNGTRFCMVIRCMGINYDLMSENEMMAVEEGFSNFLNTLKFPIQLYVQSRTLDLSEGISKYRERLSSLKDEADQFISGALRAQRSNPNMSQEQEQKLDYEIKKRRNLLDYGNDIVNYVERMSSNRDILQRKFYMVASYDTLEMGFTAGYTADDIKDMAYSELYTRCKTLQSAIYSCGIETEILRTEDLAELLFIAYNKDDASAFNVKEALDGGILRLVSTAHSVRDKKRFAKEQKLKEDALDVAQNALREAMNKLKEASTVDISDLTNPNPEPQQEENPPQTGAPNNQNDEDSEENDTEDADETDITNIDPNKLLDDILG